MIDCAMRRERERERERDLGATEQFKGQQTGAIADDQSDTLVRHLAGERYVQSFQVEGALRRNRLRREVRHLKTP